MPGPAADLRFDPKPNPLKRELVELIKKEREEEGGEGGGEEGGCRGTKEERVWWVGSKMGVGRERGRGSQLCVRC